MLNHITIMGRMTADPELRRTGSGIAVTSFTLAVDRDHVENGTRETDFIDCVAWRKTGEFVARNFTKSMMTVVSGRLQIRSWIDRDGNKRRTAEVVADDVYFGGNKGIDLRGEYAGKQFVKRDNNAGGHAAPGDPIDPAPDYGLLDEDAAALPY